ncbi:TerB family tellurite resistance protein [Tenacibaculum finnmarkense genomovar finnmarkense]|uniref:TerB family tellurite resistance protein n=1 Tax=Tenacibaculum finnmarkense TaxID=2781243 RepID=UPI000C5CA80E|nr:TerB family tellurite resistance protein [Tenacibaculum finnmarkense]MBE7691780.1 DnaJ domain-containing protein [Tenacibaculum finnmarkense genomovar finnmarkense]MCD8401711.1 TerB family tellurite resistance protein [Tenacibaculum finnmarkense genomovar finnmarkense]MCD8411405.1 TerB family tellurite resistance protein [Tenacibaculum finnmarkense genomovar ulcerans]MCD8416209.1 TerB family tellurite resistance protein [Tenacibaculum finnmarkense genomovar finnmarkense]MCD8440670.1 TerB fa
MGKFAKWLGAGVGFTMGGPIGAIIGFAVGRFIDGLSKDDLTKEQEEYERYSESKEKRNVTSGDFEITLLILASVVIKADGKIDQRELDFVRLHFVEMYGKERANNAFKLFSGIIKKEISTRQVCMQIRQHMTHSSRLQLLHFLFGISKADGQVTALEEQEIKKIAGYLYINEHDYVSIKAMFYEEVDSAYKILEITKQATDNELKKAYRKMAKKYHPDKLEGLGAAHKEGANQKFQQIQGAYEQIKKERGLS